MCAHAFAHSQKGGLLFVNASCCCSMHRHPIRQASVKSNIYLKYQHRTHWNCFAWLLSFVASFGRHSSASKCQSSAMNDIIIGILFMWTTKRAAIFISIANAATIKIPFGWIKTEMNKAKMKQQRTRQNARGMSNRWSRLFVCFCICTWKKIALCVAEPHFHSKCRYYTLLSKAKFGLSNADTHPHTNRLGSIFPDPPNYRRKHIQVSFL